jgi:sarcosine oxidase subunit beta
VTATGTTRTADVVVIGAGILGAAAAYHLAAAGRTVTVLERGPANREGSGTTAGNLHIQAIHARRPGQVVPVDIARLLPLQVAACDYWGTIEDDLGQSVELRRGGGFMVAETEDEAAELRRKHALEAAAGLPTELVDGDAARQAFPLLSRSVALADWCPLDGYANPLLVTGAYLDAAARQGADVRPFSPVTEVAGDRGGYLVSSGAERWSAPAVVNLAGPWIAPVAALSGIGLMMNPVAIQMHVTVRIPPVMECLVQHIGQGLSVKQVSAGQILAGGGWPARTLDLEGRSSPSVSSLRGNLAMAARILPFLRELRLLRMWAGPLAATPDEMPVIGEVPGWPGYFVAGGTYAFTLAPLWARCLAALVEGTDPPVSLAGLGPERLLTPPPSPNRAEQEKGAPWPTT